MRRRLMELANLKVDRPIEEMEKWFKTRTARHINLVQKYCKKISDYDTERFEGIVEKGNAHDASKYKSPEREPYVFISWDYKCKGEDKDFKTSSKMKEEMFEASNHHIKNNSHHPEYHCEEEIKVNKEDRDKPLGKMVDVTKMPLLDIAEMCADWMAMSEELGGSPQDWADKNMNIRWKFDEEQKDLIYEILNKVWKND